MESTNESVSVKFTKDGGTFILPKALRNAMTLGIKAARNFFLTRKELSEDELIESYDSRVQLSARIPKDRKKMDRNLFYNCYIFVILGLGAKIPLKIIRQARNRFDFSIPLITGQYTKVSDAPEFETYLKRKFAELDTNVLVCQVKNDSGELTHAMFAITNGNEIKIVDKNGYPGFVSITPDGVSATTEFFEKGGAAEFYGNNIAVEDYFELATSPRLGEIADAVIRLLKLND
jgi:hypothetical protein